ncbi:MAG: substrate-binding domain-containing protein [Acidimicrobiales bacterium]
MTETRRQSDDRLRLTRLARGLSQGDLARTAGVTRQAISGIESGRWSPSLDVALLVARALDSTVEGLFGSAAEPPAVRSRLAVLADTVAGSDNEAGRLLLAEVAGDTVAFPLSGDHTMVAGFVPALATGPITIAGERQTGPRPRGSRGRDVEARRIAAQTPTLAVAGCDPALALLLGPLQRHDPPVNLAWWSTCNAVALELLEAGTVHAAALHRGIEARTKSRPGIEVVGFASWNEGLAFHPRHRAKIRDLTDIVRQGLRIANREAGAEARRLLDSELSRLKIDSGDVAGYSSEANGHLLVASAIAAGMVDAAVTCEPAALAYGLEFIPWQRELSELHIPRSLVGSTEVRALLDVLAGRELPAQLAALEGYDADSCGRILAA